VTGAAPYVGRVVVTPRRQRLAIAAQVHDGAGEITRRGLGTTLRAAQEVRRVAGRELVALQGVPPQDVCRGPREPESAAAREIEAALSRDRDDVPLLDVELNEYVERLEAEPSTAVAE
jgi:hypothetical protein